VEALSWGIWYGLHLAPASELMDMHVRKTMISIAMALKEICAVVTGMHCLVVVLCALTPNDSLFFLFTPHRPLRNTLFHPCFNPLASRDANKAFI
jgi:hypothetical protein